VFLFEPVRIGVWIININKERNGLAAVLICEGKARVVSQAQFLVNWMVFFR